MSRSNDIANITASVLDGVTATEVGLGNVTNESKATMFTSPTFTGTSTFADLKATGIKHTNGTTAITINSDGSLSGKFEGAVKFVSNYKASGNPTDTNKVRIAYGITSSYYTDGVTTNFMGFGFGQPVAVQSHNGSSWSWTYMNPATQSATDYGSLSSSNSGAPTSNHYRQQGFTYTIEMDKV